MRGNIQQTRSRRGDHPPSSQVATVPSPTYGDHKKTPMRSRFHDADDSLLRPDRSTGRSGGLKSQRRNQRHELIYRFFFLFPYWRSYRHEPSALQIRTKDESRMNLQEERYELLDRDLSFPVEDWLSWWVLQ